MAKLALVGDVWYQVMGSYKQEEITMYKLYSRDYLVPEYHIKEFKEDKEGSTISA